MARPLAVPAVPFLLLAVGAAGAAEAPATGTYTEAQFERGGTLYRRECAACHGAELEGGAAGALVGPVFRRVWSRPGAGVGELYERIADTMPPRRESRLGEAENLAVLAYVLGRNNVLKGDEALRADRGYLAAIPIARGDGEPPAAVFLEGPFGVAPTGSGPAYGELAGAAGNARDWLYHNHNHRGTRYSPLDEINTGNVGELERVCAYQMNGRATMQTGPVVHRGVMYVTHATHTAAVDAATCRRIWSHDWTPRDRMVWGNNRGAAISDGYVVRGTPDGYLFALDAAAGHLLWARQVADPWLGETFTMPPMIFEDTVLIGPAGSENAISGWVGAFSLADGEEVWRFHTVPEAAAGGGETWGNPQGIVLGGGAVWTPLSMDPAAEELYVAVTNPAPDLPAFLRPGENLYTNSIVALSARTGELRWYRSIVPNDDHDWDLTQVSPVLNAGADGVPSDTVVTVGKEGILRALDRRTREVLYETPVTTIKNHGAPVTPEGVHACPGVTAGVLWNGPAFHPGENLLITPAADVCAWFYASPEPRFVPGQLYMGGRARSDREMSGWLTAVDAVSGEVRWRYRSDLPMVAGVTATGGGLVVSGELTGHLVLLDAASGEVLRRIDAGAPVGGGIVTYEAGGRQYLAAASGNAMLTIDTGRRSPRPGSVIVYALPPPARAGLRPPAAP